MTFVCRPTGRAGVNGAQTVIVPDVHAYPGHVACDTRSHSEIVVPLLRGGGTVIGVMDVDSHRPDAFGPVDRQGRERIVSLVYS